MGLESRFETNYKHDGLGGIEISKSPSGATISIYEDDVWDLTPLFNTVHHQGKKIYFEDSNQDRKNEAKWLTYLLLKKTVSNRGQALKPSTLIGYFKTCIKRLIDFSKANECSIFEIIENKQLLAIFTYKSQTQSQLVNLGAVLNHINNLGKDITHLQVSDIHLVQQVIVLGKSNNHYQQHPIIPGRIYDSVITHLWSIVREYWEKRQKIYQFVVALSVDHKLARSGWDKSKGSENYFFPVVKKFGLYKYFTKYQINNIRQIEIHIAHVQTSCKYLIHAYSGMREAEVLNLKINCFKKIKTTGGYIATIEGETTKLVPNSLTVKWVTSPDVQLAIDVAAEILALIKASNSRPLEKDLLFLSTGYLGLCAGQSKNKNHVPRFH
jgi:hypothetical protein